MLIGAQQGVTAEGVEGLDVGTSRGVVGGDREHNELGVEVVDPFCGSHVNNNRQPT